MPKRSYRHPLLVQENQTTATGIRPTQSWVTVLRVFGMVEPISATEGMRAGAVESEATHIVRMRWWSGLTAKHRIVFRERNLGILSIVNEGELDRYAELTVKEDV